MRVWVRRSRGQISIKAEVLRDGEDVLVAAAAEVHHDDLVLGIVGASFITWASAWRARAPG
jgi:hypothetical protein